jgi:hypothetical protein
MDCERAGGRRARLVGLAGLVDETHVAEVLQLAASLFGVHERAQLALQLDARVLRGELTLVEAGVVAGCDVELWAGEEGGMPSLACKLQVLLVHYQFLFSSEINSSSNNLDLIFNFFFAIDVNFKPSR